MLLIFAVSYAASAENRVALVIGNAKYVTGDVLPNDVNDARDMAAILEQHGFKVIIKTDADLSEMLGGLEVFAQELQQGGVGLFYFSGHGMEVDGKQYIAPTDAKIKSKLDLSHRMIDVNDILKIVGEGKAQLNLVILDACRNNPFAKALGIKGYGNGISVIPNPPSGSLIASATAVGDTSSAAGARNSVYTSYLLKFCARNLPMKCACCWAMSAKRSSKPQGMAKCLGRTIR
jgi:Uncharacterized protein containing caspase domain